ncbi:hypothetical protein, partial [Ruegeria halocynthiae]|uniref:hypothetical protein n=1 Tax=Ruegeria halocynthiae TaxID=985054 RepID=UPI001C409118
TRLLLTSAKLLSKMSCYAGAIHTGRSLRAQNPKAARIRVMPDLAAVRCRQTNDRNGQTEQK